MNRDKFGLGGLVGDTSRPFQPSEMRCYGYGSNKEEVTYLALGRKEPAKEQYHRKEKVWLQEQGLQRELNLNQNAWGRLTLGKKSLFPKQEGVAKNTQNYRMGERQFLPGSMPR